MPVTWLRRERRFASVVLGACVALVCLAAAPPCEAQVVLLRGLRASFGAGYEAVTNETVDGYRVNFDDNLFSPLVTVQASLALLDPRVLTLDATVDVRLDLLKHRSDTVSYDDRNRLANVRLDMTLLSGRGAPLRLYYGRSDARFAQRPLTADVLPLDLSRFGEERTKGFSWEVNPRRLPRVSAMGFVTNRHDYGSFLAGQDNNSELKRAELRANQDHRWARYDVSVTRDSTRIDYPSSHVSADQSIDFIRAATTITPSNNFAIDLSARSSRYDFSGANGLRRSRGFSGWGGDAGLRWSPSLRWDVFGNYSMSTNLAELALSGTAGAETVRRVASPAIPEGTTVSLSRRSLYQDGSGWLRHSWRDRSTTLAFGGHVLSLDPLPVGIPTLDVLRTANVRGEHAGRLVGLDVTTGAEAAYGEVRSSRGEREKYVEGSARLRLSRQAGIVRAGVEGSIRDTTAPYFYPVGGESWHVGADVEIQAARWMRLRGSGSRSLMIRDIVVQRGDDKTKAFAVGVSGPRYEVSYDYLDTDSTAVGLFETWLLQEVRPDQLLLTRPDLFGLLYATTQRTRQLSARLTIVRGLDLYARGRLDRRRYIGSYDLDQEVAQAGIVWGVRQLQLEAGWERFRYGSAYVTTRNERFFIRIRRDLPIR